LNLHQFEEGSHAALVRLLAGQTIGKTLVET
jgi:hypothetical protein